MCSEKIGLHPIPTSTANFNTYIVGKRNKSIVQAFLEGSSLRLKAGTIYLFLFLKITDTGTLLIFSN